MQLLQKIKLKVSRLTTLQKQVLAGSIFLFILYTLFGGSSQTKYEPYVADAIDQYSASILSSITPGELDQKSVDFSWNQFLNLDEFFNQNKHLVGPLTCEEFANRIQKSERNFYNCDDEPEDKLVPIAMNENVNMYFTDMNRKILGKIHLYKRFPNPRNLIYLFHDNFIKVPVNKAAKKIRVKQNLVAATASKFTKFKQDLKIREPVELKYDDFRYKDNMQKYPDSSLVRQLHTKYKDTKRARKYYGEAYLVDHPQDFNMDWKFFNSSNVLEEDDARNDKITKLTRAWLNLCDKLDIVSWLTSNNLVGWQFNGLHLPFETKFEFHITVSDLLKLVDGGYNHSIIFDYSDLNKGIKSEMFLDISPYFKMRDRNNKENLVDIRLVDIETGLFINIVALTTFLYELLHNYKQKLVFQSLAEADVARIEHYITRYKDDRENLLNTKNLEVFKYDDVQKLLPVVFENQITYIPSNYMNILTDQYFDPFTISKQGYKFREAIDLWVPIETCKPAPFGQSNEKDDLKCLKDKEVKKQYEMVKEAVKFHEKFLEYFNGLDNYDGYKMKPEDLSGFK